MQASNSLGRGREEYRDAQIIMSDNVPEHCGSEGMCEKLI